ncbi:MAG: class I SAM-dependent methyltransferase [Zoogloeaceae bacterium]|jgi:SAM-dependent methyltransferase|nr:class I SAM-dependent methyltransferase [Zoogloeaceae bacterium]
MSNPFHTRLLAAASAPYRAVSRFAWHFARGKIGGDPLFFGLLAQGAYPPALRLLDLGCGQGLLANVLTAASALYAAGDWPPDWPQPPALLSYRGIELMPQDVARAAPAMPENACVVQGDIRCADFGQADVITIFDVLHYLEPAAQTEVLARVAAALPADGRLLLRVGDAAGGLPFWISVWVDHLVTWCHGHRLGKLHCRPVAEWQKMLKALGFAVAVKPMSAGTPFANTVLLARKI